MIRRWILFLLLVSGPVGTVLAQDHYTDYMKMALTAFHNKKYDLAIGYYESALDDKQDYWPAYQGLGMCYYYQKKYKEALKAFEQASKFNPSEARLKTFVDYLRQRLAAPAVPGT